MTTASTQGMQPGRNESDPGKESPVSPSPFSELLLRVGRGLHAGLIVDGQGRIAWMDGALARASGWKEKAPEGHASEEVLGPLPWLTQALRAAFSGEESVCEGDAWGQRMRAIVLPV